MHDINSMCRDNVLAPNKCNALHNALWTSRQSLAIKAKALLSTIVLESRAMVQDCYCESS